MYIINSSDEYVNDRGEAVPYKRVRTKKIYEIVAEQLEEMIKKGTLQPGDKLDSVEQLAKKFNVGRSAIREALSALRAIGLIEMRQGEGTFINSYDFSQLTSPISTMIPFNHKEMLEFFEVRKMIESGSATIAASRRTATDLEDMKHALNEMEKAVGNENLGEKADVQFHLAVAEATHNSILIKMMHQISDTMRQAMKESRRIWLYAEEATLERLYQEHHSIYHAILDQNSSLAHQLMLAHLVKVENVIIRYDKNLQKAKKQIEQQQHSL